ncbi:MAG TPA: WG repeat-containing protein [Bacteroidia bacterium]|nr:WG repeat-containing protein [Bacteroidia bacterium]
MPELIPYRKGELWGFCDSNKNIIVEPKYDSAFQYSPEYKTAGVVLNKKSGYLDSNFQFKRANYCKTVTFPIVDNTIKNGNKYGLMDSSGNEILPPVYDYINFYSNGWFTVVLNGKHGVVDSANKIIIPFIYDFIYHYENGMCMFELNKKFGYFDLTGKVKVEPKYTFATNFENGLAYVRYENGAGGFMDKNGTEYWE